MKESAAWLLQNAADHPLLAAASAAPFLRLCGTALGGYYLIRSAALAQQDLTTQQGDSAFLTAKIATARFFATHALPLCSSLAVTIREGAAATLEGLESQA